MQPPQGYGPPPGGGYGGPGGWGPPPGGAPPGGGYGAPPGGPPGGYGAPPPPPIPPPKDSGTSPAVIALIVVVVLGVLGLGGCLICLGVGALGSSKPAPPKSAKTATVYVFCEGSPASGFTCTVTHTGGDGKANACWDIKVSCHNGALVTGHACQVVAPQGKVTRNVRAADMANIGRCNGSASTAVENVTVNIVE